MNCCPNSQSNKYYANESVRVDVESAIEPVREKEEERDRERKEGKGGGGISNKPMAMNFNKHTNNIIVSISFYVGKTNNQLTQLNRTIDPSISCMRRALDVQLKH